MNLHFWRIFCAFPAHFHASCGADFHVGGAIHCRQPCAGAKHRGLCRQKRRQCGRWRAAPASQIESELENRFPSRHGRFALFRQRQLPRSKNRCFQRHRHDRGRHGHLRTFRQWRPGHGGQLQPPVSVALDATGNLYISDRGAELIRRVIFATPRPAPCSPWAAKLCCSPAWRCSPPLPCAATPRRKTETAPKALR